MTVVDTNTDHIRITTDNCFFKNNEKPHHYGEVFLYSFFEQKTLITQFEVKGTVHLNRESSFVSPFTVAQ